MTTSRSRSPRYRPWCALGQGTGELLHKILAPPEKVAAGARVRAKLKPRSQREARITDIEGFELA